MRPRAWQSCSREARPRRSPALVGGRWHTVAAMALARQQQARRWLPYGLATATLVVFLVTGLRHLDVAPQVYEDEPWQASTAYKLLTQGVFGSDMFAGFYNMDQRYYGFMPLHPLLMAATFKVLGVGQAKASTETVLLGALTLL